MKLGLTPAYRYRTTRCSPLEHRIYKRFDEPYFSARIRLSGIEPRHNNWDEESLMFAFHRLQARPERRKMMIVICDGQPNGDADHLIETVKWIEGFGCKLIGVGIDSDFIQEVYRNAVVVTDFRQMAEELLEILAHEFRPSSI
jgi:cobaltochelatase CobT